MTAACKDCRYFEPSSPTFPAPVHETNWCGEFAPAAEAE